VGASITPGTLLKAAREAQGLGEREVADRLNMMPGYVAILERDDYQALRSPAFARGYVKAYGRLLELDEEQVLGAFDVLRAATRDPGRKRVETRPLQLQRTGVGVVVGLTVLLLLVLALWWQGGSESGQEDITQPQLQPDTVEQVVGDELPAGEQ
jgi:cytoskeleton protein RodZ